MCAPPVRGSGRDPGPDGRRAAGPPRSSRPPAGRAGSVSDRPAGPAGCVRRRRSRRRRPCSRRRSAPARGSRPTGARSRTAVGTCGRSPTSAVGRGVEGVGAAHSCDPEVDGRPIEQPAVAVVRPVVRDDADDHVLTLRECSSQSFAQWSGSAQSASAPASKVVRSPGTRTRADSTKSPSGAANASAVAPCCCWPPPASFVQSTPAADSSVSVPVRSSWVATPAAPVQDSGGRSGRSGTAGLMVARYRAGPGRQRSVTDRRARSEASIMSAASSTRRSPCARGSARTPRVRRGPASWRRRAS